MIVAIGWIAVALLGAWLIGALVVGIVSGFGLGGLESLPPALFCGAVAAIAWLVFVLWISPITVGVAA